MKNFLICCFLLSKVNLFCQIPDQNKSIKSSTEASSIKPRLTLGVGSPELINFGVALKYKKLQIAGMYGILRTPGLLEFDYNLRGIELTFLNYLDNKKSTDFFRFNYYHRVNTLVSYKDIEKYILILKGKEFKNFEIHYGILIRISGRLEKINPKYNEPYMGWGLPIWPSIGIRYIIQ